MENHGEDRSAIPPLQPVGAYPPPSLPVYQQPYPPTIPPMYQQGYPPPSQPIYLGPPVQGLPPSAYPLQSLAPRNSLATLSIILGVLSGALHLVLLAIGYSSLFRVGSRLAEVTAYQNIALYQIPALITAIVAVICATTALTYAKSHVWVGLVPSIVGFVLGMLFLLGVLDVILQNLLLAHALQNIAP